MLEIVHTRHRSLTSPAVFHLTNPNPAPWSSLIPAIQGKYAVEFAAWVAKLESISSPSSADIAEMPALKLLGFYQRLRDEGRMSVPLDVRQAKEASASMRALGPVSAELMRNWLEQWQF